ncbi:MAG: hypothetical protein FWF00_02390 [Endomicrobia bacterium]|nr:hypothetical protein [Endomicrobiia bacterium]
MKKLLKLSLLAFVGLVIFCAGVYADVPKTLAFQGRLTDNAGVPITSTGNFVFTFYSDSGGSIQIGSPITQNGVQVNNGLYSVTFDVTSISNSFNQSVWVKVSYNGTTFGGITALTASPYALSVMDGVITSSKIADGAVTLSKIFASEGLSGQTLMTNGTTVYWANVATGTFIDPDAVGQYLGSDGTTGTSPVWYASSDIPTLNSPYLITSSGVYTALTGKQDTLTWGTVYQASVTYAETAGNAIFASTATWALDLVGLSTSSIDTPYEGFISTAIWSTTATWSLNAANVSSASVLGLIDATVSTATYLIGLDSSTIDTPYSGFISTAIWSTTATWSLNAANVSSASVIGLSSATVERATYLTGLDDSSEIEPYEGFISTAIWSSTATWALNVTSVSVIGLSSATVERAIYLTGLDDSSEIEPYEGFISTAIWASYATSATWVTGGISTAAYANNAGTATWALNVASVSVIGLSSATVERAIYVTGLDDSSEIEPYEGFISTSIWTLNLDGLLTNANFDFENIVYQASVTYAETAGTSAFATSATWVTGGISYAAEAGTATMALNLLGLSTSTINAPYEGFISTAVWSATATWVLNVASENVTNLELATVSTATYLIGLDESTIDAPYEGFISTAVWATTATWVLNADVSISSENVTNLELATVSTATYLIGLDESTIDAPYEGFISTAIWASSAAYLSAGNQTIDGNLSITNSGALTVSGATALSDSLNVTGLITAYGGSGLTDNGLLVQNAATIEGVLTVNSAAYLNNSTISGNLNITNSGTLTVAGATTLTGALTLGAGTGLTVPDALTVTAGGATITAGDLTVTAGNAIVGGNATVDGTLTIGASGSDVTLSYGTVGSSNPDGLVVSNDLLVNGDIYATGTLTQNADVAEIYASYDNLLPGDVVIISSTKDEYIEKSKIKNDTMVAGVISTAPGVVLNSNEKGYKLALVGKVPVNVTNENGDIKRGDLIVTSSTPGCAMKGIDPKPGTVIGKALENSTGSKSTIMVLVNLQ